MKKVFYLFVSIVITASFIACSGGTKKAETSENGDSMKVETPQYTVLEKPQVDLSAFTTDKDGYIVIFNGKDFTGWRGYGKGHRLAHFQCHRLRRKKPPLVPEYPAGYHCDYAEMGPVPPICPPAHPEH